MSKKLQTLIKKINKALPEAEASTTSEFYGKHPLSDIDGIWFKGSESIASDGYYIFDYYEEYTKDTMGVHPTLYKILDEAGWSSAPYDAGTLMAWED